MSSSDFQSVELERVATVEMGQSPSSTTVTSTDSGGLPFLQGNAEFSERFPKAILRCQHPPKKCEVGDALISVRAPVGALNEADQVYCIGRGLAAVRFTGADARFGYHELAYFSSQLRRVAQGTTFEAVGRDDLLGLRFPLPPRAEQRRIAEILDTLDETIRSTTLVIEKLMQIPSRPPPRSAKPWD